MKKGIIYNLNPINNETKMSSAEYIIKKILAFILIYVVSAILGEGVVIGILCGMGYDPLNGIMPDGQIGDLLLYYGLTIFILVTIFYCKLIEKRTVKSIGLSGNAVEYLAGGLFATILLGLIIGIGCISKFITFDGFNANVSIKTLLLWIVAFAIQGAREEIMCRGFLLNSLKRKISTPMAVLVSSTAFVVPHLSKLLEAEFVYIVIGIINLYLISFIFSVLVLWKSNLWMACGLHSIWNYILYTIMGLSLSGSESVSKGIFLFHIEDANILNGAEYGIEASIVTTVILGTVLFAMIKRWKGGAGKNGIS